MDRLKLDEVEVAANGETDLAPTTQCDNIEDKTRSYVLNKAHRYASVCAKVFLLKVR